MYKNLLQLRATLILLGGMLVTVLGGHQAIAQGVTTSSINGVVTDDKGGELPGATVIAIHKPSGTKYGITTNTSGRFTFPAVRIGGPYEVTVTFIGFQEQKRTIPSADLGVPAVANFKLLEEGKQLSEVVVTTQRGSLIDAERTGASTNFKREAFERLPTLNRNFQDIAALTPQNSGGFSFGGRSNLYNNFSIDGATSNNVFGLSPTPGGQSSSQPVGVDAIQELSVQLAPYDVSQGSFTGAGVNAVTRSGTNEIQGSAYYFVKNQSLINKKVDGVDNPITKFTYNNYGFRVGGPIIKNKLFFFVNGEWENSKAPAVAFAADSPNSQAKSADLERLRTFLVTPNNGKTWTFDPGTYNSFDAPIQSVKFLAKIDWNISDQHKLSVRYNQLQSYRDVAPSNSGGFASAPPGGRQNSINAVPFSNSWYRINNNLYSVIAELNSSFGKGKFANNLQVGYNAFRDFRQSAGGGDPGTFPTVDIVGPNGNTLTSFGPDPFTPNNKLNQDVLQINDKFDMFLGDHTVTLGTANEFYSFFNAFTQQINGVYQYNSIDDFIANATTPSAATATTGLNSPTQYLVQYSAIKGLPAPAADWKANQLGFYAQDAYSGIKNLKVTLGIRVDIPSYPKSNKLYNNAVTDTTNFNGETVKVGELPKATPLFSPRIGFNYDVFGTKKLQIRGGTGIFTGRIPFVWISNQLSNNGVFFGQIQGSRTNPLLVSGQPNFANTNNTPFSPDPLRYTPTLGEFTGVPQTPTFAINATVNNFKFPQVWRTNLAADYSLPGGFVATLEGIYTKDINAVYIRDANLSNPVGTLAGDGRPLFGNAAGVAGVNPPFDRRINDRVTQALVIDNTNKGYAFSLTGQIQKTTGKWNGSLAYTFTDSKDLNSQSGSTAGGLFSGNQIIGNPNTPNLSFANNWTPHRIVANASYRVEYLKSMATTIAFTYIGANAGNFSYTYNGSPNSDGVNGNDLMYIPRNQSEILLTTTDAIDPVTRQQLDNRTPQQIWDQLNNYIEQDKYLSKNRGRYAERNAALLPWFHNVNLRILQDFFVNVGTKRNTIQFSLEVLNVLNFLNSSQGLIKTPVRSSLLNFVGYETPNTNTAATTGRPVYSFALQNGQPLDYSYVNSTTVNGLNINSRYQVQLGLRYIFN